jgi:anti-sigma B factor antagonist
MAPISVTLAPRDPPAAVVALVGEHDAYSAARLDSELTALLDEGLCVVVDLRDTEFIDSTTLGTLIAALRHAERARLGLTFVLPRRNDTEVNQLLEITGIGATFAIFERLDHALAAARGGTTKGDSVRSAA